MIPEPLSVPTRTPVLRLSTPEGWSHPSRAELSRCLVPKSCRKENLAQSPAWPTRDPTSQSGPSTVWGERAPPFPVLCHFWEKLGAGLCVPSSVQGYPDSAAGLICMVARCECPSSTGQRGVQIRSAGPSFGVVLALSWASLSSDEYVNLSPPPPCSAVMGARLRPSNSEGKID